MDRPSKIRRVCRVPATMEFAPCGVDRHADTVVLTVDEYEAIRLTDLEGMTQEECAAQMAVSRASICSTLDSARRKLADMVVNGKRLKIAGGSVVICGRDGCHGHRGGRGRCCECHPKQGL